MSSSFVWHKTTIVTEQHNIHIRPSENLESIVVETRELDGVKASGETYLNRDEMELLVVKMREMMNYLESKMKPKI